MSDEKIIRFHISEMVGKELSPVQLMEFLLKHEIKKNFDWEILDWLFKVEE